jgi:hypothetical protein
MALALMDMESAAFVSFRLRFDPSLRQSSVDLLTTSSFATQS